MSHKHILLNTVLIVILGILCFKLYQIWATPIDSVLPPTKPKAPRQETQQVQKKKAVTASLKRSVLQVIPQRDIFSPSRGAIDRGGTQKKGPSMVKPPRLFGTVIIDGDRRAILEDPVTKVTRLYRINESIAGLIISRIEKDRVILKGSRGRTIQVRLRNAKGNPPVHPEGPPAPPHREAK